MKAKSIKITDSNNPLNPLTLQDASFYLESQYIDSQKYTITLSINSGEYIIKDLYLVLFNFAGNGRLVLDSSSNSKFKYRIFITI